MQPRIRLAAASRDGHLALRRAERQQRLIELLTAAGPEPISTPQLAQELVVSARTIERDLERLRDAGVPIQSRPGRAGGHTLTVERARHDITLGTAEVAAIISSLSIVGPNSSASATSAMATLAKALRDGQEPNS